MICSECRNLYCEMASSDYPYPMAMCAKGHWEGEFPDDEVTPNPWEGCKDFEKMDPDA